MMSSTELYLSHLEYHRPCVLGFVFLLAFQTAASKGLELGGQSLLLQKLGQDRQILHYSHQQFQSSKNNTDREKPIMVCGTKTEADKHVGRRKRYTLSRYADGRVNKWETTYLTWALVEPSRQLHVHTQRRIIRESLQKWSAVSSLEFAMVATNDEPDITIRFATGRHGPYPDSAFDGRASDNRANILAHAWGPGGKGLPGDVHIDEDDDWSNEYKLEGVLVHELGHSMGLQHSDDPGAIMFFIYRDTTEVAQDDIDGIRFLYGSNRSGVRRVTSRPRVRTTPRPRTRRPIVTRAPYVTAAPKTTPAVVTMPPDSPCLAADINAVVEDPFSVVKGLYYMFIGGVVHHLAYDGHRLDSMDIEDAFPGVPRIPDVVFTISEKKSVFFIKDDKIYEFKRNGLTKDSPRSIGHANFPEKPSYSVSMFDLEGNRRFYLFGKRFWWSFHIDEPRQSNHYEHRSFSHDLPSDVQFVTKWSDNQYYVVSRDSYVILDIAHRSMVHDAPYKGLPPWMQPLCSRGLNLTSHLNLLILAVASLASLLLTRRS